MLDGARIFHVNVNCRDLERSTRSTWTVAGCATACGPHPTACNRASRSGSFERGGTHGSSWARKASRAAPSTCSSGRSPPRRARRPRALRVGLSTNRAARSRHRRRDSERDRKRRSRVERAPGARDPERRDRAHRVDERPRRRRAGAHRGQREPVVVRLGDLHRPRALGRVLPATRFPGARAVPEHE